LREERVQVDEEPGHGESETQPRAPDSRFAAHVEDLGGEYDRSCFANKDCDARD
jgi:hypothetical protein